MNCMFRPCLQARIQSSKLVFRQPIALFVKARWGSNSVVGGQKITFAPPGSPRPPKPKLVTVEKELPDVKKGKYTNMIGFVSFCVVVGVAFMVIIKYEEATAPVVLSTLYTIRRSPTARSIMGDQIDFDGLVPYISGQMTPSLGVVDFSYWARGDKGAAKVVFKSLLNRPIRKFEVHKWGLELEDGTFVSLIEEEHHPFVPGKHEQPTMKTT